MTRIRAVLFDMDGLLIDSEPFWQDAEMEVFGSVGLTLTRAQCLETTGLRIDEVVAHWFARAPWPGPTPAEVTARIVARVVELVRTRGQALPGAREAVVEARRRVGCVGLATSSPRALIDAVIERLDLRVLLDGVASGEDEVYGKPHPAVYLTLAQSLRVPPTACLAFEDSVNGMISAKAARMACVAVPEAHHRHDRRFALADLVLGSLVELDEGRWRALLGEAPRG
jgi:sugar-phosphatase